MSYEPPVEQGVQLDDWLDTYFGSRSWRATGHRFVHLGDDCEGKLAGWFRPSLMCPITYLPDISYFR